ncbi:hypothetical protein BST95_12470 [Halioglobus japonicus]|uniref:Uncharacterized protein n=1 Tax=Halioglobus japonicus TaxID=930805 RepID=A0AAP8SQ81_9GAMM|nr:hypothetical protein [Halioglobus japonicus]AQA18932.1 hypothetical protein BST95_12470 [Halioglobus japonicus]PLW88053.1 hypothetical protein C0029_05700 [Halioglobus japonicus]GHD20608.1 hypothetical protein GCM10007052_30500 [Halioglobus japonicus]
MPKTLPKILGFALVLIVIAVLAMLTLYEEDPCANLQNNVSGAVLADDEDQSAMVNRAIVERSACEERE